MTEVTAPDTPVAAERATPHAPTAGATTESEPVTAAADREKEAEKSVMTATEQASLIASFVATQASHPVYAPHHIRIA